MALRTPAATLLAALLFFAGALPSASRAQVEPSPYDEQAALAYSQAALGRQMREHAFLDSQRNPVRLADYRGKPLVVNLVYTACDHTCPLVIESLRDAVAVAQDAFGADSFAVVTIGFDSGTDTPAQMRAYAHGRGVKVPNWTFLSGDDETIAKLSEDLGFIFFPSPRGFDHLAQTTVIDESGRVYQHVYGADFGPPALVEPLKGLALGKPGTLVSIEGLIERVKLFCTFYDPASERYKFDYSLFFGLFIGFLSLAGMAFILGRAILRNFRRGRPA